MKVLITGDSQSGLTGKRLQALLIAAGHQVKLVTMSGKPTGQIVLAMVPLLPGVDRAVMFSGGNNPSPTSAAGKAQIAEISALVGKVVGRNMIIVGPPPATTPTNTALAMQIFGVKQHSGETAARREAINAALKAAATSAGFRFADFRSIASPFPAQADGIHVDGPAADKMAAKLLAMVVGSGGAGLWAGAALGAAVLFWRQWRKR